MTASSQTPPGALPPEAPMPDAARAAFAAYGAVLPVPAGPLPATPEQEPQQSANSVQAATGVITAAMEHGQGTAREIAQAEQDAGLLFDPQRAQDIADAAREQARAECAAELAQAQEARTWFHDRWKALNELLAGRPDDDLMFVHEILAAADPARPAGAPLSVTWDGLVMGPSGDTDHENTLVPCTTAHGAQAFLVLRQDQRQNLASLLGLQVRDINAPCPTDGCGTVDDYDASDPAMSGWARLEVAGIEDEARWYCSPGCVSAALARAGQELAAADELAAIDPDEQAPVLLVPEVATGWETVSEDLDRRYGPGASDEYAMQVAEATEAGFEDERGDVEDGGL